MEGLENHGGLHSKLFLLPAPPLTRSARNLCSEARILTRHTHKSRDAPIATNLNSAISASQRSCVQYVVGLAVVALKPTCPSRVHWSETICHPMGGQHILWSLVLNPEVPVKDQVWGSRTILMWIYKATVTFSLLAFGLNDQPGGPADSTWSLPPCVCSAGSFIATVL